jgi:DNA repair protein RadA/Sms
MILAVLESRCGIGFAGLDVFLNVAGGLRLSEPAADLAVAAALVSARQNAPLPEDAVVFGEISLSGAVRPAPHVEARLREAAKLGFRQAFTPTGAKAQPVAGLAIHPVAELGAFMDKCFGTIDR